MSDNIHPIFAGVLDAAAGKFQSKVTEHDVRQLLTLLGAVADECAKLRELETKRTRQVHLADVELSALRDWRELHAVYIGREGAPFEGLVL